MNLFVIILVGVVVMALLVFTILANRKDRRKLESELNRTDDPRHHSEHGEDPDDVKVS